MQAFFAKKAEDGGEVMVRVKRKEKLNETVGKMELEAELIAKKAEPGQFVIVRAKEESERIPLTIADYDREEGTVTIIYQIVGAGTMGAGHGRRRGIPAGPGRAAGESQ